MKVMLYGERNTGTRFLQQVLKANFHVEFGKGWKHAAITEDPGILCITISKSPENWIQSLYRRPYEMSKHHQFKVDFLLQVHMSPVMATFSEFIRAPWPAISRDRVKHRIYETPLDLYHEKLRSYEIPAHRIHYRYEDLIMNVEEALAGLPLARRTSAFVLPSRSTKMTGGAFETTSEVIERYRAPSLLDPGDQQFILSRWRLLDEQHGATLRS